METKAKNTELKKLLADSENALGNFLVMKGKTYPTDEWVTVKAYCKLFNITNTKTVSNWISRGEFQPKMWLLLKNIITSG